VKSKIKVGDEKREGQVREQEGQCCGRGRQGTLLRKRRNMILRKGTRTNSKVREGQFSDEEKEGEDDK
jgi:hypothetical protein